MCGRYLICPLRSHISQPFLCTDSRSVSQCSPVQQPRDKTRACQLSFIFFMRLIFVNHTVILCETFVQPDTTELVIKSVWQTLNDNMMTFKICSQLLVPKWWVLIQYFNKTTWILFLLPRFWSIWTFEWVDTSSTSALFVPQGQLVLQQDIKDRIRNINDKI